MSHLPARDDRGAVTAETAVALPVLVLLALGLAWLTSLGVSQVRVTDAARETARALARGEDRATSIGYGQQVAPEGARFTVTTEGGLVRVVVTAQVGGPGGLLSGVPGFRARAVAVTRAEQ